MKILRFLVLLLLASHTAAQLQAVRIEVQGQALVDGSIAVELVDPGNAACGTYQDCNARLQCRANVGCFAGDTAEDVAARIALFVEVICFPSGFQASAAGNVVTITGPSGYECCLGGPEMASCIPGPSSLPLDSGGSGCVVNNVCNGVSCDENLPHVSGLSFRKLDGCSTSAASIERNPSVGGCQNPDVLTASAPPVLLSNFTITSNAATGHTQTVLFGYATPLTFPVPDLKGLGSVGPNLLCNIADPGGELLGMPVIAAAGGVHLISVPLDPSFCGFAITIQGVLVGGVTPLALTEAIDQVVGS